MTGPPPGDPNGRGDDVPGGALLAWVDLPSGTVDGVELGVAWRGCDGSVGWATLRFPWSGRDPFELAPGRGPLALTEPGERAVAGPVIAYLPRGVRAAVSGGPDAGVGEVAEGGFVVAWVDEENGLVVRRVADEDEELREPAYAVDPRQRRQLRDLFADVEGGAARIAGRAQGRLVTGGLTCRVAEL
ncbi:MAG: hypothetical protein ACFCGT_23895 [Sandaracinaceae bacterium]